MERKAVFKTVFILAVALGLFLTGVTSVFAVQGATDYTLGATSRASFTNTSTVAVDAMAGNVTQLDLYGDTITTHWAGFYGNISGNVTLQDSDGKVFYDWTGVGVPAGEIFASSINNVAWAGISCANSTLIDAIDTSLGIVAADADGVFETFAGNTHPNFQVGSAALSGCNSTNAYSDTGRVASLYYQILLVDTAGTAVYTTLINDSATSFTGTSYDFELLVGESDGAGSTSMYFYIELD
ncbi:MAG: hypothetical protein V1866_00765 [archaeon]